MTDSGDSKRTIILLHGFAAHWALMTRLEKRFSALGANTVNWGYNSWFKPIEHHAARLHAVIQELDADESVSQIDFVTHSMGCIITRVALLKGRPSKCGRWVQLAPPNRGSHIANSIPQFIKSWMRPVDELQSKESSYVNQLPIPQDIDIAVIQATRDYIVAEPLTHIPEEKDRLIVPGLHSQMLFREDVARQSFHFLDHGHFAKQRETAASPNAS